MIESFPLSLPVRFGHPARHSLSPAYIRTALSIFVENSVFHIVLRHGGDHHVIGYIDNEYALASNHRNIPGAFPARLFHGMLKPAQKAGCPPRCLFPPNVWKRVWKKFRLSSIRAFSSSPKLALLPIPVPDRHGFTVPSVWANPDYIFHLFPSSYSFLTCMKIRTQVLIKEGVFRLAFFRYLIAFSSLISPSSSSSSA